MKYYINYQLFLYFFSVSFLLVFTTVNLSAQVTIGSKLSPNHGALLDIKENNELGANASRGLALSRVELIKLNRLDPCVPFDELEPTDNISHIGLFVYNVTDDPTENLCPGLYVWNGSSWNRLSHACEIPINPGLLASPNCYIVKPGQVSDRIPIGKAYAVWNQHPELGTLSPGSKVSVEILWQDKIDLIQKVELVGSGTEAMAEFQVTTKTGEGNALAAVRIGPNGNSTDPIAWSWHIWVTNYDPEGVNSAGNRTFTHNNGEVEYTFMDRNLGFLTGESPGSLMGLVYQWGRKDPFTSNKLAYSDPSFRTLYALDNTELTEVNELATGNPVGTGIKHAEVTWSNTLKNSISNPTTFYYGGLKYESNNGRLSSFDWYTSNDSGSSGNNNLWGTSTEKSEFDPCPVGWRVPAYSSATKSPWAKFEYDAFGNPLAVFGSYGATLNAIAGATELGFYPYGFVRLPRSFRLAGSVGSGAIAAGGLFFNAFSVQDPEGSYWTATAVSGTTNAKLEYFRDTPFGFSYIQPVDAPRAQSAWVRCVRE